MSRVTDSGGGEGLDGPVVPIIPPESDWFPAMNFLNSGSGDEIIMFLLICGWYLLLVRKIYDQENYNGWT